MPTKAQQLENILYRMNRARIRSQSVEGALKVADSEGAHYDGDDLLTETVLLLAKGSQFSGLAASIVRTYKDPTFKKHYA